MTIYTKLITTRNFISASRNYDNLKLIYTHLNLKINKISDDLFHLTEAINWLKRAQDITPNGGVSWGYSLINGWQPSYPETTGYIIPTFLDFYDLSNSKEVLLRAIRMGDWEILIQLKSGAIRGGMGIQKYPSVFNSGQVIFGWNRLYQTTNEEKYLYSAKKAGDWLVKIQDDNRKWSKHTYMNIPHAYHSRVDWALLYLYEITNEQKYKKTAFKNIKWIMNQTKNNGWIKFMGFTQNEEPFTHTIAYTLRGLIECVKYVDDKLKSLILNHLLTVSSKIISSFKQLSIIHKTKHKFLPARLNSDWKSNVNFSCITGNIQLAIIFLELFKIMKIHKFRKVALYLIEQAKSIQLRNINNPNLNGTFTGSLPLWGNYQPFNCPNWGTKFFCDALMMKMHLNL